MVTGSGKRIVVIGDSWSAGLGLADISASWPSRLKGRVHVFGFSGSGFSAQASPCGRVSFADRAPSALRGGAELVIIAGGLNDFDQSRADIKAGFARVTRIASRYPTVIVGPAMAPARQARVPRVERLLRRWARRHAVPYVSTTDLRLPYRRDRLHLTGAGHRAFGDAVARRITALGM